VETNYEKGDKTVMPKAQTALDKVLLSRSVTVGKYKELVKEKDRQAVADFISERFTERYITPIDPQDKSNSSGFTIMAVCCLMIEALEAFRCGYSDTRNKSQECFKDFFRDADKRKRFGDCLINCPDFYDAVRCGLLHQAETRNGWLIHQGSEPLVKGQTINAVRFLDQLKAYLQDYTAELRNNNWDATIWKKLREKMDAVISNCQPSS
jgi:protein-arginine kinase activator protein McsA